MNVGCRFISNIVQEVEETFYQYIKLEQNAKIH